MFFSASAPALCIYMQYEIARRFLYQNLICIIVYKTCFKFFHGFTPEQSEKKDNETIMGRHFLSDVFAFIIVHIYCPYKLCSYKLHTALSPFRMHRRKSNGITNVLICSSKSILKSHDCQILEFKKLCILGVRYTHVDI